MKLKLSRLHKDKRDALKALWLGHQIHSFPHGTGQNLRRRARSNAVAVVSKHSDGRYGHSIYHVLDPHPYINHRRKRVRFIPVEVDVKY